MAILLRASSPLTRINSSAAAVRASGSGCVSGGGAGGTRSGFWRARRMLLGSPLHAVRAAPRETRTNVEGLIQEIAVLT
jgi:hypothetical protein